MGDELRKYVNDYMKNWKGYEGPLARKLAITLRNRTKANTVGRGCCGHFGEPGC